MSESSIHREELNRLSASWLDAYIEEHREITDAWRNLDTKAQGSVAIAGIFAAVAFTYTREVIRTATRVEKYMLSLAVVLLIFSVILAVFALIVRRIAAPPLGDVSNRSLEDLLAAQITDQELPERLRRFKNQQIARWRGINEIATNKNASKGRFLLTSQILLMSAVVVIGLLTLVIIYSPIPQK